MFTWDQNCQTDSLTVALNLEALAWRKRQFSRSLPLSLFHLGGSQSTPSTPDGCVLCEHPGSRLVGGLVGPSWFCWCCVAGSGCFGCAGPAPSPKIDNCCRIGVEKKHLHHCPAVLSHHRMSYLGGNQSTHTESRQRHVWCIFHHHCCHITACLIFRLVHFCQRGKRPQGASGCCFKWRLCFFEGGEPARIPPFRGLSTNMASLPTSQNHKHDDSSIPGALRSLKLHHCDL